MRLLVPSIILAVAIILAPVLWYVIPWMAGDETAFQGPAIDSGARIEIEMLNQQMDALRAQVEQMQTDLRTVANRPQTIITPQQPNFGGGGDDNPPMQPSGPNDIIDAYAQVVLIANRRKVNDGLVIAGPSYLAKTFGLPANNLDDRCRSITNPRLADKLVTENVGPIKVQMMKPAVESLRRVFENVRATDPDLYARINTAGSLCVRLIRGSSSRASTHAYGLAVDLNIDGHLDTLGDGRTQLGLTILADFFKAEGWVWGAAWSREDSMHFEVSRQQLDTWISTGDL